MLLARWQRTFRKRMRDHWGANIRWHSGWYSYIFKIQTRISDAPMQRQKYVLSIHPSRVAGTQPHRETPRCAETRRARCTDTGTSFAASVRAPTPSGKGLLAAKVFGSTHSPRPCISQSQLGQTRRTSAHPEQRAGVIRGNLCRWYALCRRR